jgi:hypothetical protein
MRGFLAMIAKDVKDTPDNRDPAATRLRGPRVLLSGESVSFEGVRLHLEGGAANYSGGESGGEQMIRSYETLRLSCYLREVLDRDPKLLVLELNVTIPKSHDGQPKFEVVPGAYDPTDVDAKLRPRILYNFQEQLSLYLASASK